jgi:hypothetical protein
MPTQFYFPNPFTFSHNSYKFAASFRGAVQARESAGSGGQNQRLGGFIAHSNP